MRLDVAENIVDFCRACLEDRHSRFGFSHADGDQSPLISCRLDERATLLDSLIAVALESW